MSSGLPNCRITVLKRTLHGDLVEEFLEDEYKDTGLCECFEDGQEFVIDPGEGVPVKGHHIPHPRVTKIPHPGFEAVAILRGVIHTGPPAGHPKPAERTLVGNPGWSRSGNGFMDVRCESG